MDCRIQGALRFVASSSICGLFIKNVRKKNTEQLNDNDSFPFKTACLSYITINIIIIIIIIIILDLLLQSKQKLVL